jgi:glycosyltransferase involved in cell wall biosynthesis
LPAYRHGGPIISVHLLNKWLAKLGVQVTVYTTDGEGKGRLDVPPGKPVGVDGVTAYYFPRSFPKAWWYSRSLASALKERTAQFDIVHITSVFLAASTLGARAARHFKKPYIISPRGSLMKEPLEMKSSLKKRLYIELVERRNLAGASAVHFTNEVEKQEYIAGRLPLSKSVVIPNGFEPLACPPSQSAEAFKKQYNISAEKSIIFFLSRLSWKKGLDTLIPAFERVAAKEPKAVLVIAGGDDEGYEKTARQLVAQRNLERRVIFTGMLGVNEKCAAYQAADVFVLPSYSENFGMAVLEALSFELPVVVTEGVALSGLLSKEGAGVVVKKDEGELGAALLRVLREKDWAKAMGARGREIVEREFSPKKVAEAHLAFYRELVGKNS